MLHVADEGHATVRETSALIIMARLHLGVVRLSHYWSGATRLHVVYCS